MKHNQDIIAKVNSMTKYPSIQTYHKLDKRGRLQDELTFPLPDKENIFITEKIDGTNARIILLPDDLLGGGYLIGSRQELLTHSGDMIYNPSHGIVDGVRHVADSLLDKPRNRGCITVLFGELYGGNIGKNAQQYSSKNEVRFRAFDYLEIADYEELLDIPCDQISLWRESGGQQFKNVYWTKLTCACNGIEIVPDIRTSMKGFMPEGIGEMLPWLSGIIGPYSRCKIDNDAKGFPEGVIARTADRRWITKMRYEDYKRYKHKK